jgi:hypothetical protein
MGQRRVVDVERRDKVLGKFTTWLRDVWGRPDVGSMLQNVSKEGAEKWAVEYIKYRLEKGVRSDALNRERNEIALSFRHGGGNDDVWRCVRVNSMVQSGRRNNNEQREHVEKQLANEKYPWNFGVIVEILKESGAMDRNFKEGMDAKEVEVMAYGLMLLLMFELGPRKSNLTGEGFKQKRLEGPGAEEDEEEDDENSPAFEMSHAMIWSDWEFEMILVTGKGEPLWAADGKYLTEWWVGGPVFYAEFKRRGKVWHVRMAKTRLPTSKASRSAKNAAAQMKTAELGRRTVPEARGLEILLYWILWSGMPASKTPGDGLDNMFLRRAMGGSGRHANKTKKLRVTDAVKWVKEMSHNKGVAKSHVAAKGLRSGYVCAAYLFAKNEIEARDRAVGISKARAGNWEENSRVTKEVYLHTDDRGPLAMTSSWEEGVEIGGGFDVWIRLQGKRPEKAVAKGKAGAR